VRDVPDQNLCRENTLFGNEGKRWIPMDEIAENPHAFTEGIDDSWNPRLEQMNHPYYISDPEGEHWDGDENPLDADVPSKIDPDGDAEGITPVPTGVEDLYDGKVAAPTNMDYGFCVGDDSSEYLIHQESESRFIDTDTTVKGSASNPNKCMLDNSQFEIDEDDLDHDNFEASTLQNERMIYDEGASVSFDSGSDTRSVSCFNGRWWGEWPVVFLEDVSQTSLGETGYSTFRVINPESSSRTIDLDLSFGGANEDVERMVSFSETDTDEMTVDIPGETSVTYDIQVQAQGGNEIEAGDENTVELQGRSQRGDLDGYDDIDILVTDTEIEGGTQTRDVPGLQPVQLAILALIATLAFFFKD